MAARALRAAADSARLHIRGRVRYHHAPSAETMELRMSNTRDNGDVDTLKSSANLVIKETGPKGSGNAIPAESIRQRLSGWRLSGWRFGVLNFAMWALVVFIINLVVTIWGTVSLKKSQGVLSTGECGRTKTSNSGLHVVINILSTILLSGSNYCMQCLSAPTRSEIDKAHASRRWLDIGVPSVRNLRHIGRRRLILWILLAASSLPLHLLYNSAVYVSISTNDYNVVVVSQAFVDDPECRNCTNFVPKAASDAEMLRGLWSKSRNGSLDRLSPAQCIAAYGTLVQSTRRNLLVVAANENLNHKKADTNYPPESPWIDNTNWYMMRKVLAADGLMHYRWSDPLVWMCSSLSKLTDTECVNRLSEIKTAPGEWVVSLKCSGPPGYCDPYHWPVDYCLSEPAEPLCQLHFSPIVAIIVTVLNFCKAALMLFIVVFTKEDPLMNIGDAVASFLDNEDIPSDRLGLLSSHDCKKGSNNGEAVWINPRWRWKDATSKKRRMMTLLLFEIVLGIVTGLLIWGVRSLDQVAKIGTSATFGLGFGAVDPRTLISSLSFPTDMILLALIANSPQVILSFLYFAYNSLFTAMLMGHEWTSYASKRKGLRVSRKSSGFQRSTYFLQLPYRFGIPLVILSGTLHWLVSQSIFVVAFDVYDDQGKPVKDGISLQDKVVTKTCGYSPIAMLAVLVMGLLMVIALVGAGYIPYRRGIPLAGSCSLAISAACHPEKDLEVEGDVLSQNKLQWGVVSTDADGVGHCAFSSKQVRPVEKGCTYI